MAPTVMYAGYPRAWPTPRSATPMVPMVPNDVPVATDATEQSTRAESRKCSGAMSLSPQ